MSLFLNVFLVLITFANFAYAAKTPQLHPEENYLKSVGATLDYQTNRPEGVITFYKTTDGSFSSVAKDEAPVSIRSVKQKIMALDGVTSTLKNYSQKNGTVFGFQSKSGQFHLFSTRGGYLQITPSPKFAKLKLDDLISHVQIDGVKK